MCQSGNFLLTLETCEQLKDQLKLQLLAMKPDKQTYQKVLIHDFSQDDFIAFMCFWDSSTEGQHEGKHDTR